MKAGKQRLGWLLITTIFILAAGELFSRFYLGLGNPPLSVADPQIEYLLKPNQDVKRFRNRILTNQYGMRSDPFPAEKSGNELRVMVFGDSVLNGGNIIGQTDLATSILRTHLIDITGRDVVVGNISANSWGPGNWLAYSKKYGFFDADVIVLVVSSHDYADNPTFQPLNPNTLPTEKPLSALTEWVTRSMGDYLPSITSSEPEPGTSVFAEPAAEQISQGLEDLRNFLTLAKNTTESIVVIQHWEKDEIDNGEAKQGNKRIRELSESLGISPVQLEPYLNHSIASGINPYHDFIHPNQAGQQIIGKSILDNFPDDVLNADGDADGDAASLQTGQ